MEYSLVIKNLVAFILKLAKAREYGTLTIKLEAGEVSHVIWAKSIRPEDLEKTKR